MERRSSRAVPGRSGLSHYRFWLCCRLIGSRGLENPQYTPPKGMQCTAPLGVRLVQAVTDIVPVFRWRTRPLGRSVCPGMWRPKELIQQPAARVVKILNRSTPGNLFGSLPKFGRDSTARLTPRCPLCLPPATISRHRMQHRPDETLVQPSSTGQARSSGCWTTGSSLTRIKGRQET